jgi:hypothetical protein
MGYGMTPTFETLSSEELETPTGGGLMGGLFKGLIKGPINFVPKIVLGRRKNIAHALSHTNDMAAIADRGTEVLKKLGTNITQAGIDEVAGAFEQISNHGYRVIHRLETHLGR